MPRKWSRWLGRTFNLKYQVYEVNIGAFFMCYFASIFGHLLFFHLVVRDPALGGGYEFRMEKEIAAAAGPDGGRGSRDLFPSYRL